MSANAISWLGKQIAWESRLTQLRTPLGPITRVPERDVRAAHDATSTTARAA